MHDPWEDALQSLRTTFAGATPVQTMAFLASVAQRLYPNYRAFCVDTDSGDPDYVGWAVGMTWKQLQHRGLDSGTLLTCSKRLEGLVPERGASDSIYTELARLALASIDLAVCGLIAPKVDDIPTAATLSLDSVRSFLRTMTARLVPHVASTDSLVEEARWLAAAPPITSEIKKLQRDANVLCEHPLLTDAVIAKLREDETLHGIQPFARGLLKAPKQQFEDKWRAIDRMRGRRR